MLRSLVCLLLLTLSFHSLFAQSAADTIEIVKKKKNVYEYRLHGNPLSIKQLKDTLYPNRPACTLLKKSRSTNMVAYLFAVAGGAALGYELVQVVTNQPIQWAVAGTGAALIALSLPINHSAAKKEISSIRMYNDGLYKTSGNLNRKEFYLTLTGNGLGLRMVF